jgi:CPA1 family monovalent cation:H+ antiporter
MQETEFAVKVFILLLLVASAVAMATRWIRVPYSLALVIIGLLIAPMHFLPVVHISPELILLIFLPALLFEAAWNLDIERLRKNLVPILSLAVAGVCVSLAVIGVVLRYGAGMSWSSSLLFGAMISATDPVSVLALFRKFGLPARLFMIIEGESLLNDGTAAVLFRIIAGLVIAGTVPSTSELLIVSIREFGIVVFGGIAVGAVIGMLLSLVALPFDDHRLEITLTTVAAYGSYLMSDSLHVSGVIAVLAAGLVLGNFGRRMGMSPTAQIAVTAFWEYMAFVSNSLVFLLIGLDVNLSEFLVGSTVVLWGIAAMLAGRVVAVYPLLALTNRVSEPVPVRWAHTLVWGGLRGSLSIALVLSLPATVAGRSQLVTMVFGAVLFSLLVQGLALGPLLTRLKFSVRKPAVEKAERVRAQMACTAAAMERLEELRRHGMVPTSAYEKLRSRFEQSYGLFSSQILDLRAADPTLEEREHEDLKSALVDAEKSRLIDFRRHGAISDATFHSLEQMLNDEFEDDSVAGK